MASIERVISKRKGLRVRLKLAIEQLEKALDSDSSPLPVLDGSVTKVQNLMNDLNIADDDVTNLLDPGDIENDVIESAQYSDPIYPLIASANLKRESIKIGSSTSSQHGSETSRNSSSSQCKLPKFELQSFNGDPLSWQGFWDQFSTAIHENSSLTDIDRFNYLKRYLKNQAADTISGLTLSSENYKEAIQILRSRFGNPQVLISAHVEALLKANRIKNKEDIKGLRKLYNDIESCIRNLKTLKLDVTGYGCVLIPILKAKLPDDLNILIARKFGDEVWTLELLMKHFHGELRAQENCVLSDQSVSHGRKQTPPYTASGLLAENNSSKLCVFCGKGMHNSSQCRSVTNSATRWDIVKDKGLCFICLGADHKARSCQTKYSCRKCQKRHNVALCPSESQKSSSNNSHSCCAHHGATPESENETSICHSHSSGGILLQTAWVRVSSLECQCEVQTRVLFDSGSQRSYITEEVRKKLKVPTVRTERVILNTFGATNSSARNLDVVKIKVKGNNKAIFIEALCVPEVCNPIKGQNISFAKNKYPHLESLCLADRVSKSTISSIGILIGVDFYHKFFSGKIMKGNEGPVASETIFGWVLSGMLGDKKVDDSPTYAMKCTVETTDNLREDLKRFWEIENLSDDDCVVEKFKTEINFDGDRYVTKLPFRSSGHDELADNYLSSKRRLENLKPKLLTKGIFGQYNSIFKDYEKNKIIERVPREEEPMGRGMVHYLPHRPVVREDKSTTKIRAVFDASATTDGTCLNDCLYPGPNLLLKIFDILLRFRLNKIAIVADIKQAFLNIGIHKEDQDYLRFLWYDTECPDSKIVIFRFLRVVFGLTCSPFLLNGTIRHHLSQYLCSHKEFISKFLDDLYVDDTTSGCASVSEGKKFFFNASNILKAGAFELRKWKSNDPQLQAFFDEQSDVHPQPAAGDDITFSQTQLGTSDSHQNRVLGVSWDTKSDEFVFDFQGIVSLARTTVMTKRNVLRLSASIYDPLGFLCPITARLKTIFQMLCKDKLDWDAEIPQNIKKVWEDVVQSINEIRSLHLPRFVLVDSIDSVEMHGFCDASKDVYCGVIYLKYLTKTKGIFCKFLCAKSKVAPMKLLSIPRLELLGCELLSNLIKDVKCAIAERIELSRICCWSDSQVALFWIKGKEKVWKPWVENRVEKIRQIIPGSDWNHVRGEVNPADIPTRCIKDKFDESVWKNGPDFLSLVNLDVCEIFDDKCVTDALIESKKGLSSSSSVENSKSLTTLLTTNSSVTNLHDLMTCTRFGSLGKLLRTTALVLRFINRIRKKRTPPDCITVQECNVAMDLWIHSEQIELKKEETFGRLSRSLSLFEDKHGILRLRGRFGRSNLNYNQKHPAIIRHESHLTKLIVLDTHKTILHQGVSSTLSHIRLKFWIVKGKKIVKKHLGRCTICKKAQGTTMTSPPATDLPEFRIDCGHAFQVIGLDNAGPLFLKDGSKCYILLLTCATSRALHLELTPDLGIPAFLRGYQRFAARRGTPDKIISDNFKTFRSKEVKEFLTNHGVTQQFILPASPWWGGFYERLVRTVKSTLRKVLGKKSLTFEELTTVLCEVEAVINSRPLTHSIEEDHEETLTPNHLIYGRDILRNRFDQSPNAEFSAFSSKRCRFIRITINHFWSRFKKEYLGELRQKQLFNQRKTKQPNLTLGDVVLVKDDTPTPRSQWKLGRIEELIRGADNVIRGVKLSVLSKKGTRTTAHRPLQKIIPFEIAGQPPSDPDPVLDYPVLVNRPQQPVVQAEKSDMCSVPDETVQNSSKNKRRAAIVGEQTRRLQNKYM